MGLQHSKVVVLNIKSERQGLRVALEVKDLLHGFANFWVGLFQILQSSFQLSTFIQSNFAAVSIALHRFEFVVWLR